MEYGQVTPVPLQGVPPVVHDQLPLDEGVVQLHSHNHLHLGEGVVQAPNHDQASLSSGVLQVANHDQVPLGGVGNTKVPGDEIPDTALDYDYR